MEFNYKRLDKVTQFKEVIILHLVLSFKKKLNIQNICNKCCKGHYADSMHRAIVFWQNVPATNS